MRRNQQPTATGMIFAYLCRLDDFATAHQIQAATREPANRVSAALHKLREYKAVECMESDGQLWWYATPATDTRQVTRDGITPFKHRGQRKPRDESKVKRRK